MSLNRLRGGLFLDRDGILNELVLRSGQMVSPRRMTDFAIVEGAAELLLRVDHLGIARLVVTNQPDIARGHMTVAELQAMHAHLRQTLPITDIAYCPHDDASACDCRKPKAGMLRYLGEKWRVSLSRSVIIGDTARDMGAGRNAGCFTILVGSQETDTPAADVRVADLSEAIEVAIAKLL